MIDSKWIFRSGGAVMANITNSDILAVLLYYTHLKSITSNLIPLSRGIRAARETCCLLDRFCDPEYIPATSALAEARNILKQARILKLSDDLSTYIVSQDARRFIATSIMPLFSERELKKLTRAAEIVARYIR